MDCFCCYGDIWPSLTNVIYMKKQFLTTIILLAVITTSGCVLSTKEEITTPIDQPNITEPTNTEPTNNELKTLKNEVIILNEPRPETIISSPLKISGEARGTWFFEASFPVILVDWDGLIIAEGIATAKSDWMTENYVPFEATLDFIKPNTKVSNRGALILQKDNPSGESSKDDALEITVYYK